MKHPKIIPKSVASTFFAKQVPQYVVLQEILETSYSFSSVNFFQLTLISHT